VVPAADVAGAMLRMLREQYGVRWLLCEGGAAVNGLLFDAGLVDEYFLTIAPRIVGGDVALTPVRADRPGAFAATWPLSLVSAIPNAETGEVYLRYRVARTPGVDPA
jgi:riboflavin biosynthesis pyrimidine reductase